MPYKVHRLSRPGPPVRSIVPVKLLATAELHKHRPQNTHYSGTLLTNKPFAVLTNRNKRYLKMGYYSE